MGTDHCENKRFVSRVSICVSVLVACLCFFVLNIVRPFQCDVPFVPLYSIFVLNTLIYSIFTASDNFLSILQSQYLSLVDFTSLIMFFCFKIESAVVLCKKSRFNLYQAKMN